jgi:hypothetical protein
LRRELGLGRRRQKAAACSDRNKQSCSLPVYQQEGGFPRLRRLSQRTVEVGGISHWLMIDLLNNIPFLEA